MAKYSTDKMREMIAKEKKKLEDMKGKEEYNKAKKELRELRMKNLGMKAKPVISGVKKFGATLGKLADNIEVNSAGVMIGSMVEVTKGDYKGVKSKVLGMIPGGIQCMGSGRLLNIRHGSYRKL